MGWALVSSPGPLWAPLGSCGPGPCWAGPLWAPLGPCGPPWALAGRALVGPPGHHGPGPNNAPPPRGSQGGGIHKHRMYTEYSRSTCIYIYIYKFIYINSVNKLSSNFIALMLCSETDDSWYVYTYIYVHIFGVDIYIYTLYMWGRH